MLEEKMTVVLVVHPREVKANTFDSAAQKADWPSQLSYRQTFQTRADREKGAVFKKDLSLISRHESLLQLHQPQVRPGEPRSDVDTVKTTFKAIFHGDAICRINFYRFARRRDQGRIFDHPWRAEPRHHRGIGIMQQTRRLASRSWKPALYTSSLHDAFAIG